tara:strand:- start:807 stop:1424 length:618 start_codon:yes stop_codon:yes gene_type:complete
MSKKTLLNESQVRQFMKLAKLEPLTPGFVQGLTKSKRLAELRTGRTGALGPKGGTANPGHGRGQGEAADGSLFEEEAGPEELEDYAVDDLEDDSLEGDEEAAHDELEAEEELPVEDVSDRTVSVKDFLSALEVALEDAIGDEVEIDADEMEPEEEEEIEMDVELPVDDVDIEADDEELLEASDELVEQVTKRVAARILKTALAKK